MDACWTLSMGEEWQRTAWKAGSFTGRSLAPMAGVIEAFRGVTSFGHWHRGPESCWRCYHHFQPPGWEKGEVDNAKTRRSEKPEARQEARDCTGSHHPRFLSGILHFTSSQRILCSCSPTRDKTECLKFNPWWKLRLRKKLLFPPFLPPFLSSHDFN